MAVRVSVCFIVRNEAAIVAASIRSVADLVHEVIVIDTMNRWLSSNWPTIIFGPPGRTIPAPDGTNWHTGQAWDVLENILHFWVVTYVVAVSRPGVYVLYYHYVLGVLTNRPYLPPGP